MTFSGFSVRYFSAINSGNFLFEDITVVAQEIISGGLSYGQSLRIGFTGTTGQTKWYFSFINGQILDPEGRGFASYDENDVNSISGNFDSGTYNYYLNGELINAKGVKTDNDFNGWFVECISGATGQCNVYCSSTGINTSFYMQSGFYVSGIWSGTFTNNHTRAIVIRSGELLLPDAVNFALTGTGLDFRTGTNVVPSEGNRTVRVLHTGNSSTTGIFTLGVRIHTDYGYSDFIASGSGIPYRAGYVSNAIFPTTGQNIVASQASSGLFSYYFSTTYQSFDGTLQPKPFAMLLSRLSGYTGNFYSITGLSLTNSGSNYTSPPMLYVTPTGSGCPFASGSGILYGGTGTGITGVNWYQTGVWTGNTGICALAASGGGGTSIAGGLKWAPAYNKSWSSFVTGWTGYCGATGTACAGNTGLISGIGTLPTGYDMIKIDIVFNDTPDTLQLQYLLVMSGLPDTISGISLYSGSGLLI